MNARGHVNHARREVIAVASPKTQTHAHLRRRLLTSQLLTASSGGNPATNAGKVLVLFFDIYAITVVATLAGSFGAFFHQRSREMDLLEHELSGGAHEPRERL